jgi:hypothetical protein
MADSKQNIQPFIEGNKHFCYIAPVLAVWQLSSSQTGTFATDPGVRTWNQLSWFKFQLTCLLYT